MNQDFTQQSLALRADFPFLAHHDHPVIYVDNAATTLKPQAVVAAIQRYDTQITANLHRGLYRQAELVTTEYAQVRQQVADLLGAQAPEIVFTAGATAGINFIAHSFGTTLQAGDEIIVTELEHHANLLPWLELAKRQQLLIRIVPVDPSTGTLDVLVFKQLLNAKTKLLACSLMSNVLGVPTLAPELVRIAKAYNPEIKVLLDAAQAVPYLPINVVALDCDFLVFSGHKIFGPTGVGVLFIKHTLAEQLRPYQFGGGMLFDLDLATGATSWLPAPYKFEAGTPPIAQVLGLGAALTYFRAHAASVAAQQYLAQLTQLLINGLNNLANRDQLELRILGDLDLLPTQGHLVSFVSQKYHAHDIAAYLDQFGICVRAGQHCAQPLHQKLGVAGSVRVSFQIYNNAQEVDCLLQALAKLT